MVLARRAESTKVVAACLLAVVTVAGCGGSKEERQYQQAATAYDDGVGAMSDGGHDRAVALFSEAIRLCPGFADAYRWRGLAHQQIGHVQAADADTQRSQEIWAGLDSASVGE